MSRLARFLKIEKMREGFKAAGSWSLVRQGDILLELTLKGATDGA